MVARHMKALNRHRKLKQKALSIREMIKEFARIHAGQKQAGKTYQVGGRLFQVEDNWHLLSEDQTLELKLPKDSEAQNHDIVLVEGDWNQLQTEVQSFDIKIKRLVANKVTVLSPSLREPFLANTSYIKSRQWNYLHKCIRRVFDVLDYTEVRTPNLLKGSGTEPYLDLYKTANYYLPSSPELHLKKMLCRGWNRIFEIKTCFRKNENSDHHQPEFEMLEWYHAFAGLEQIEKEVRGLFNYLKLHWHDPVSSFGPLTVVTVAECFTKYCDFELTPQTSRDELVQLCQEFELSVTSEDSWNDLFFKVFLHKIEPELGKFGPQIIKYYPSSQCAYARIGEHGWAERFEVYWKGLELANAYEELTDPQQQRQRFEHENQLRGQLGKEQLQIDKDFLAHLESGMPPCGGIALGVDRLFMALVNESKIQKQREFPL